MFWKIKNCVEHELKSHIADLNRVYRLRQISPIIFNSIKDFALRKGKRVRPALFIIGYLGFSKKIPQGLYRSAVSLELLHDFMLIHDDIIDKSDMRRGKPAMHVVLQKYIGNRPKAKFNGQDLAIVLGDMIYAFSIHSFLSVKEDPKRKEAALKKLLEAAFYTGSGEFIELLCGLKSLKETKRPEIDRIYDFKTATYTFAAPLTIGATLAGAKPHEIKKLFNYGISLGRAFQIKDDIIGLFGEESEIGKPNLTDIREAKKTLLVWYAYHHTSKTNQARIRKIFGKDNAGLADLLAMRKIVTEAGALSFCQNEIRKSLRSTLKIIDSSSMKAPYKNALKDFSQEILTV